MSLQQYIRQLRSERNLTTKLQFTEAYNIPIQKDSDVDDFVEPEIEVVDER